LHDLRHSFVAVAFEQGAAGSGDRGARPPREPEGHACMYAGLTGEGREKAIAELTEGGFGR